MMPAKKLPNTDTKAEELAIEDLEKVAGGLLGDDIGQPPKGFAADGDLWAKGRSPATQNIRYGGSTANSVRDRRTR